mmetsp:Transcript_11487/g.16741  ORF Transcript_11487/g.16741 Transcript_11487/m.16741 type:complete len:222 (-) Transcript_11487:588-1253(-)
METVEELAISLVPPTHPVIVFEIRNLSPWLDLLSKVTFNQGTKVVNSKGMNQVLHTSIGTHVTISVITLSCENTLHALHHVFLRYKSEMVSGTCKGSFLVVCSTHSSAHHHIESFQLALVVGDHDASDIIGVDVDGVVSGYCHSDFELTWQVSISIQWFSGVGKDDAPSGIASHVLINIVVLYLLTPVFDRGSLFSVKPNLGEGRSHRAEKVREDLRPFVG